MAHNRRQFLKASTTLALGSLVSNASAWSGFLKNSLPDPGIQLFTFFNSIDDDVVGTLKKIASLGYKNIESAFSKKGGYYGMKPKEFRATLEDLGLTWRSHHVFGAPFKLPPNAKPPTDSNGNPIKIPPMRNLQENMQELIDEAAEGGVPYLVCANIPVSTPEEVAASIETLNRSAEAATKAGLIFAYHNHDWEFKDIGGSKPYDVFISQSDPTKLKFELDIAWAVKGGADPLALFKANPGRFPLWHVKDLDQSYQQVLPLGEGVINYKEYFKNTQQAGLQYFFIEHDMPADAFASITTSMKSFKRLKN